MRPSLVRSADLPLSGRELLRRSGLGFGMLGLAGALASEGSLVAAPSPGAVNPLAPKQPHFRPRAKRVIHLYMNGGPSQVDTFDPKPALERYQGQRPAAIANLRTENGTGGVMPSPSKLSRCCHTRPALRQNFPHTRKC